MKREEERNIPSIPGHKNKESRVSSGRLFFLFKIRKKNMDGAELLLFPFFVVPGPLKGPPQRREREATASRISLFLLFLEDP